MKLCQESNVVKIFPFIEFRYCHLHPLFNCQLNQSDDEEIDLWVSFCYNKRINMILSNLEMLFV